MTTSAIRHHPETPRANAARGRIGSRRVQPLVTERSSWITMTALGFLALIGGAAAQFTGTYYPKAPVNVGTGSEPLLIAGGAVTQLLFGNGAGLHVGQLDPYGGLKPSPKQIDARTGLHHSKHVATYEDGSYALTLEVPLNKVEACKYGSNWELTKCTPIYTWATNDPDRFSSDIAASPSSTMVTFHHSNAVPLIRAYFTLLDQSFEVTSSGTDIHSDPTPARNPSVIWQRDKYRVGLEFDDLYGNYWHVALRGFSEAGLPLGGNSAILALNIYDSTPLNGGPPDLKLSNLGSFGDAQSWEYELTPPVTQRVHFHDSNSTDLGTYTIGTSDKAHSAVFSEINGTLAAGAIVQNDAGANQVILKLFQKNGSSVEIVGGSTFIVFENTTDEWASVSIAAIQNEAGLVVTAEKTGFIWTRAIYFKELTPEPTPPPTQEPTPVPTVFPTSAPINPPGAPSPNGSGDTQGSTSAGTQEDTSEEGSSTTGHAFTVMTPAPPTPEAGALIKKEDKAEGSSVGLIVGATVGVVGCSAIAVGVARSLRRGSFRNRKSPVSGRDRPARRVSSKRVNLQAAGVAGALTQGNASPAPGDNMTGLYAPTSRYGQVPALPGQASTGVTYSGLGVAQPMGQTYGAAAVAPVSVNYGGLGPAPAAAQTAGYGNVGIVEGGMQRTGYAPAHAPLKA